MSGLSSRLAATEGVGARAEKHIHDRLREALAPEFTLFQNVAWLVRDHGVEREGEADVIVAHPDRGFLVIEVKSGPITRDGQGRWWAGGRPLDRAPFEQAADSRHSLVAKLRELPDWPSGLDPMSGHAVAFPNAEVASLGTKVFFLGPDADPDLIIDRAMLEPDGLRNARLRAWVDTAFELWSGGRYQAPGKKGIELLEAMITSPLELRSLLRSEIKDGNARGRAADRRAAAHPQHAAGSAPGGGRRGSGDRQDHARDRQGEAARRGGVRDPARLLQLGPRARARGRDPRGGRADRARLTVSTFHQLAEDLGREAGTLAEKPDPVTDEWFAETLPAALDDAIGKLGPRYHAIVVDEGQDFDAGWLASLDGLLHRWSRGRPLRLPRPGAVDLPCRPDRGAGPDRISRSTSTAATPRRSTS